ncbi:MAG: type transport system ATP-binding protein [Solirubrobacteraceae bacterium]|nr:type transport system ATP-binding protein [Solirubrobacteraceae bacterium]
MSPKEADISDEAVYRAEGLTRSYDGRKVVDGFSAVVRAGEVAVLVGPNGCGKTTSVEMSLGLRRVDEGRAFICGHDVHREARAASRRVGVALQGASLNNRVRTREHLEFFAALFRTNAETFAIAEQLGLDAVVMKSLYGSLSGGQQRRVLVATALAGLPALAVLDEPTSGVDIESRAAMWTALRGVRDRYATAFLVTTHDLGEAEQYADTVIVMREGKVAFSGRPEEFVRSTGVVTIVTIRSNGELERASMPAPAGTELRASAREVTFALTAHDGADRLRSWVDQTEGQTFHERTPTFEDAYLVRFSAQGATDAELAEAQVTR